jgi:chemotaxis protein MotB
MSRVAGSILIAALVACSSKKPVKAPAPAAESRTKALEDELAQTKEALQKEHDAAEGLRKAEAAKADEAKALQDKLAEVVGQAGEVTTADGAVKLELVDQILFPTGEADLTDKGREVLAKVGAALKEVDKQIWVQGHTDDQPILIKKPKPEPVKPVAKPAKLAKGAKPAKPVPVVAAKKDDKPDAMLPFITNWELSAARALTVVHYLQDEAKLDPTRLAAVAFSQYRPVSKVKAKNRRIEIVLYPRVAITPK